MTFRLLDGQNSYNEQNNLGVSIVPEEFTISQNYPNPFNASTTIKYSLPQDARVQIAVYNLLGQKVKTLADRDVKAGYHFVKWNSRNENNKEVSSGMYFYVIQAENIKTGAVRLRKIKKMVLLK